MKLILKEIKEFSRRAAGVTNANGFVSNGYLYVFEDENGKIFTKYSHHIWDVICKFRTKASDELLKLQEEYRKCGMNRQANDLEGLLFEGDEFDFNFTFKINKYNQNGITRIKA